MDEWLRIGIRQVQELLDHDAEYQQILRELSLAEQKFKEVMKKQTVQDQEYIENYITLCEELEYQRTHTAYRCGKLRR